MGVLLFLRGKGECRTLRLDAFRERVDWITDLGTDRPEVEMRSRRQYHSRGEVLPW